MTAGARRRLTGGLAWVRSSAHTAIAAAVLGVLGLDTRAAVAQEVVDLPAEDRPLSPDLELVYRIGSAGAEFEWEQFSSISGLGFDAAGNLHLMDRPGGQMMGGARIVAVDAAGGLAGEFGRAGDGPGEFRFPRQMVVWADGSILVVDIGRVGHLVFGPGGDFERMGRGGDLGSNMRPERTGTRTLVGGSWDSPTDKRPILRFDLSSEDAASQTLVEAWAPRESEARKHEAEDIEDLFRAVWGFEPELLFDALPTGGIAFADSSAYVIKLTNPSGTVSQILRRPIRPLAVTEGMRRAERERRIERLRNRPSSVEGNPRPEDIAFMNALLEGEMRGVENMRFYSEVPVISALRTTWDGTLWIQRSPAPGTEERGPIDVLTQHGRYVGTIAPEVLVMPDAFGPGGLVAFVDLDEFDVPVISVSRLPTALR